MKIHIATLATVLTTIILIAACGSEPDPAPTPTAIPLAISQTEPPPTETPLPSPTTVPTVTPAPTATFVPTSTPMPTPTPQPTATPVPTATPAPTHTPMPTPVPMPAPTQAAADLPTTEVVRILAPSIVKIIADRDAPNDATSPFGLGTGVIIDEDGHILTSGHVVEGIEDITVTLYDGRTLDARIVGLDRHTDIAVIKIPPDDLYPAPLGDSSNLLVGQDVIAIGHALGLGGAPTVSKGVVSALDRTIGTDRGTTLVDLIQTDASINLGNSGGPLVSAQAEVVGINTSILRFGQGIGFAVSVNDARIVADHLVQSGAVRRGYMGVLFTDLTPRLHIPARPRQERGGRSPHPRRARKPLMGRRTARGRPHPYRERRANAHHRRTAQIPDDAPPGRINGSARPPRRPAVHHILHPRRTPRQLTHILRIPAPSAPLSAARLEQKLPDCAARRISCGKATPPQTRCAHPIIPLTLHTPCVVRQGLCKVTLGLPAVIPALPTVIPAKAGIQGGGAVESWTALTLKRPCAAQQSP